MDIFMGHARWIPWMVLGSLLWAQAASAQITPIALKQGVLQVEATPPLQTGQRYVVSNRQGRRVAVVVVQSADGARAELKVEKGRMRDLQGLSFKALAERKARAPGWGIALSYMPINLPVELSSQVHFDLKGSGQELRFFNHFSVAQDYLLRTALLFNQWQSDGPSVCRSGRTCVYKATHVGAGMQFLRRFGTGGIRTRCGLGLDLSYAVNLDTNVFEEGSARFQIPMQALCDADWRGILVGLQAQVLASQSSAGMLPSLTLGYLF